LATGLGAGIGMLIWGPMYARGGGALVFSTAAKVAAAGAAVALLLAAVGKPARVLPEWNR